jgi:hypothetical protein
MIQKLTARLSDTTHQRLVDAAKADRNSLNAELEFLLTQALNAREETGAVSQVGGQPVTICAECGCLIGLNYAQAHLRACGGITR